MIFLVSFFLHADMFTSLSIGCSVHMMACLQNTRHLPWCKSRNSYCLRLQLPTISHSFWCHIVLASSISKRRDGTFCCCRHIFFSLLVHAIVVRRHRCRLWSLQWQCSCRMSSVKWEKVVAEDETKQQEAFACMKLCLRTDIKYDKFQRATFSAPFCYSARLLHRLDAHMRHTIRRHEDAHKRHHAVATHTHTAVDAPLLLLVCSKESTESEGAEIETERESATKVARATHHQPPVDFAFGPNHRDYKNLSYVQYSWH